MPLYKTEFGWVELLVKPSKGDWLKLTKTDPTGFPYSYDFRVVEVRGEELVLTVPPIIPGRILRDAPFLPVASKSPKKDLAAHYGGNE